MNKPEKLKAKEKSLSNKDRRLKELQKKLCSKEINLSGAIYRTEYSKVFISQLMNKIKELGSSNRFLKMKMLAVPETAVNCQTLHDEVGQQKICS